MWATIVGALVIFAMRIVDVSIGTVRIIVMLRGHLRLSTVLGFFESLTWVVAASLVFSNLGDPVRVIAFSSGFASGILVGGLLERRIALGTAFIRVVAPVDSPHVAPSLREQRFPVTVVNAEGTSGEVRISFLVIPRKDTARALAIVHETNPQAFVTVEDVALPDLQRVARRQSGLRK